MVNFVFRKNSGGKSIEMLFFSIQKQISLTYKNNFLKHQSNSVIGVFNNIVQVFKLKGVCHITGDTHYVALNPFQKNILTIHDVNSILTGNKYELLVKKIIWFYLPSIFVSRITVISNFSKNELLKIIPFFRKKIHVIYNPVNPSLKPCPKIDFNRIVLHIGTKSNKNLTNTILALKGLECILLIVGNLNKEHIKTLDESQVKFKNFVNVSYEMIKSLYEECDIVSFVSLYEGFGMPIIEAQKVGRAVITSNVSAIPEIGGDSVHYVDPYDVQSMKTGFVKLINDNGYRKKLIKKGFVNIKRFDFDKIVNEYKHLYKSI